MGSLDKHYLCWLMNQIHIEGGGPDGYSRLCEVLQDCAFFTIVRMDENRREEGMSLRNEAESDMAFGGDIRIEQPFVYTCSMMEIIVVMARRMNYEMLDSEYEADIGKWAIELFSNAGLSGFTNSVFDSDDNAKNEAEAVVKDIVYHRYGFDGEGGLFPLKQPKYDQRTTELLTQMNNYLAENYDIC